MEKDKSDWFYLDPKLKKQYRATVKKVIKKSKSIPDFDTKIIKYKVENAKNKKLNGKKRK